MAKIYISSTYQDLMDVREHAYRLLRRMGHDCVAMEDYVATDERPVEKCKADVAACDLYIGIFAWRYGHRPPNDNPGDLSITEMEYRHARTSGKHCLIFLLSEDAPWLPKFSDTDFPDRRIDKLRKELSQRHTCSFFTSAENIDSALGPAIHAWAKEHGHIKPGNLNPELDLAPYYNVIRQRYQRLDLDALTPPQKEEYMQLSLSNVFVEQSVRENPPPVELPRAAWQRLHHDREVHLDDLPEDVMPDNIRKARESYFETPARLALEIFTDPRHQRVIILGDPGAGKSTLSRYVALSLIDPAGDEKLRRVFPDYVSLLVELRSYAGLRAAGKCETFLDFLEYLGRTEGWRLNVEALSQYLKTDGRAVVIFDGLDEIFDPEDRERITHQITGFASDYPKARIIVTSRVIGYRRKILTDAGFTHFTLQDLDEKQVESFITRWYHLALSDRPDEAQARRKRILRAFSDSASIRQLASNPMLLTIMAIIGKHQELPRERWKLYDHAASVLIQHWDINKHLKEQAIQIDFIGEEEKKEMLRRLAHRMQSGTGGLAGNYIHREELEAEFVSYLKDRFSLSPDRATTIARQMIGQFRERNFILCRYGANLYGFVHRAFLEFFCASAFVLRFEKTKELSIEQLKQMAYDRHWEDRSWHEVLRLICGMIDEKFASEIIDHLIDMPDQPKPGEYEDRKPWNLALAIQCLGEVNNINAATNSAARLLKALCVLFESGLTGEERRLDQFLTNHVAMPAEAIGRNWPHRAALTNWVNELKPGSFVWDYSAPFGIFIGSLGREVDEIHQALLGFAKCGDENLRGLFPWALAKGWPDDPETAPLLYSQAHNDDSADVRRIAVMAIAEHYRQDKKTLSLLTDLAVSDPNEAVRSTAISLLAEYFQDEEPTLPILRDRAVNDLRETVRSTAISLLAEHFRENRQIFEWLLEWGTSETNEYVRRAALYSLADNFRSAPETLPLLCDRATSDPHELVRSGALLALTSRFREAPETLLSLQDRSVNDQSEIVRFFALQRLVDYFRKFPETLALVSDRAENDPVLWLKEIAGQMLYKLSAAQLQ
jgi:HEAT repeat protein